MFIWTPPSVEFRRDAETFFHISEKIASKILPHLQPDAYVCDAGCGLGYLALDLARRGFRTDAVDTSSEALAVLRENSAASPHPLPLQILQEDLFEMHPKEFYTDMVFSFFGSIDEILKVARQQCKGQIYIIRKTWSAHTDFTMDALISDLKCRDIPYTEYFFTLEMGQPFRTLEEAAAYLMLYGQEDRLLMPDEICDTLTQTGDSVYPYSLPAQKELGILILRMDDIRKNL